MKDDRWTKVGTIATIAGILLAGIGIAFFLEDQQTFWIVVLAASGVLAIGIALWNLPRIWPKHVLRRFLKIDFQKSRDKLKPLLEDKAQDFLEQFKRIIDILPPKEGNKFVLECFLKVDLQSLCDDLEHFLRRAEEDFLNQHNQIGQLLPKLKQR